MYKHLIKPPKKGTSYRGRFRIGEHPKVYDVCLHTTNKEVATRKLDQIFKEFEEASVGIGPAVSIREAARTPLADLFQGYLKRLDDKNRSPDYIKKVRSRFPTLCEECRWQLLGDITAKSFEAWRKRADLSNRTLNHYQDSALGFLNWLVKTEQLQHNPLAKVEKLNSQKTDGKNDRALSWDEFEALIEASPKRREIYTLMAFTGLRVKEVRELLWGDVIWKGTEAFPYPHLQLREEQTKARRADVLPLLPSALDALLKIAPNNPLKTRKVFPNGIPQMNTLKGDLERAGIPHIDSLNRPFTRHGFRRTYITWVNQIPNLPKWMKQQLTRHTSESLSDNLYTDPTKMDLYGAISEGFKNIDSGSGSCFSGQKGQNLTKVDKTPTSGGKEVECATHSLSTPRTYDLRPTTEKGWRRRGDSNPRYPCGAHSLSRRAHSATLSPLHS